MGLLALLQPVEIAEEAGCGVVCGVAEEVAEKLLDEVETLGDYGVVVRFGAGAGHCGWMGEVVRVKRE